MKNTLQKCKICAQKTSSIVGINLKAIPICDSCTNSIFLQQAKFLFDNETQRIGKNEIKK